jgi:quinol monooxygenase YgiN
MSGTVVIARLRPQQGKQSELLDVLRDLIPAVHEEPGCTLYAAHVDDATGDVVFVERYVDAAAFADHENGSALAQHGPRLRALLVSDPELAVMTPFAAGDGVKGVL